MTSIAGNRGGSKKPKFQEKKGFVNLKINIRLLPPNLTEDLFYEQLSKYTTALNDGSIADKYYVKGSYPEKPYEKPIYSRAYLLFKNQNTMAQFVKELTNRPFIEPQSNDSMIPMIGNALYHKMPGPSQTAAKIPENALENDDIYKEFLLFLDGKVADFNVIKVTRKIKKKKRDRKRKEKKASERAKVEKPTSEKKGANGEVTDQHKSKSKAKRKRKSKKDKTKEDESNSNQGNENVNETKDKDQTATVDKPKKAKKPRKRKKKTANTDSKPADQPAPPLQEKEEIVNNKTASKDQDKPTSKKPRSKKKKNKNPEKQKDQEPNSESKSEKESTPATKPKPKPKKKIFKNNKPPTNSKLE